MIKRFAELRQFVRPWTSNLPEKVSVLNLMRLSVDALVLLHSVRAFPVSSPSTLSQFPVAMTGDHLPPGTPTASVPRPGPARPPETLLVPTRDALLHLHTAKPAGWKSVPCLALCSFLQGKQTFSPWIHPSPLQISIHHQMPVILA